MSEDSDGARCYRGDGYPIDEGNLLYFKEEIFPPDFMSVVSDAVDDDSIADGKISDSAFGTATPDRMSEASYAVRDEVAGDYLTENGGFGELSECFNPVNIAERRAAEFGFNVSMINPAPTVTSPATCLPFLTIPSLISPDDLLDSPIMLSNSQLSPTTGTFPLPSYYHGNSMTNLSSSATGEDICKLMLHCSSGSNLCNSGSQNQFSTPCNHSSQSLRASLTPEQPPFEINIPPLLVKEEIPQNNAADLYTDVNITSPTLQSNDELPQEYELVNGEDGYNWRKYGQKQVKGSEYPRSYYKCTHVDCPMKKIVERSHDGHITEIVYKGFHSHTKPTRRSIIGSTSNDMFDFEEDSDSNVKFQGVSLLNKFNAVRDDNTSVCDFEPGKFYESSSTRDNNEDGEDGATKTSIGDDGDDDDESYAKRRKENYNIEASMICRGSREQKVVLEMESDVDIVEDGYRWRKYGQKVVKGNPNPRSYYKCTYTGCRVRKHVERAANDLTRIITTYEGKHNHPMPPARNNSSSHIGTANLLPNPPPPPPTTNTPKIEKQFEDHIPHFEQNPEFKHQYPQPPFLENYYNNNFASSSLYNPIYYPHPPIENSMPYSSSLQMNSNFSTLGLQNLQVSLPSIPFDYNNYPDFSGSVQPFLAGHGTLTSESDRRVVIVPKQEQIDDIPYDSRVSIVDHANAVSSSSMDVNMKGKDLSKREQKR